MLLPSIFLDSSCYSDEYFQPPHRKPIPYAFDSTDDYITTGAETETMPPSARNTINVSLPAVGNLPSVPGHKAPRPALPRPLNITAYTQPSMYGSYIDNVLAPSIIGTNTCRSSVGTMADSATMAEIRKENGLQFADLIAHEMNMAFAHVRDIWVRDTICGEAIPPHFEERFRSNCAAWNNETHSFRSIPGPHMFTEENIMQWLTSVATELGDTFGHSTPLRSWSNRTATSPPVGGTQSRKPDLSLVDADIVSWFGKKESKRPWAVIKAFAEVTQNNSNTFATVVHNIIEKAYLMFETQSYRRFVLALGFFQFEPTKSQWALILIDRSGVISTMRFECGGMGGITLAFVLYLLSFSRSRYIGVDESMKIDKFTGMVTHITVVGETTALRGKPVRRWIYKVIQPLHSSPTVSGRATLVWLVWRKGKYYVLKDSWPLQAKPFSEIQHLIMINRAIKRDPEISERLKHKYPIFVIGEELGDSTELRRKDLGAARFPRVHRRVVTKPVGDPLTSFRSKYELCSVFCDVVECKRGCLSKL